MITKIKATIENQLGILALLQTSKYQFKAIKNTNYYDIIILGVIVPNSDYQAFFENLNDNHWCITFKLYNFQKITELHFFPSSDKYNFLTKDIANITTATDSFFNRFSSCYYIANDVMQPMFYELFEEIYPIARKAASVSEMGFDIMNGVNGYALNSAVYKFLERKDKEIRKKQIYLFWNKLFKKIKLWKKSY